MLATTDVFPVVETGDIGTVVTFGFHAPAADSVLLFVNRLTDETDVGASLMEPVGEGWWVLSYRLGSTWRGSYAFVVHPQGEGRPPWEALGDRQVSLRALLDGGVVDPRNPVRVLNRAGSAMSVAQLPDAPAQPWLGSPPWPRPPATLLDGREVWCHRVGTGEELPVVVHLDGEVWLDHHGLPDSLDRAHAAGAVPAHVAVFVSSGSVQDRWRDAGRPDGLAEFVARRAVPWVRDELDVSDRPQDTVVAGQSLGGLTALWVAARHGDVVGRAIAQSASLWLADPAAELAGSAARVRLEVGLQEWVLLPLHRELAARAPSVDLVEFDGGHDYACWRGGLLDAVADLLADRPLRRR